MPSFLGGFNKGRQQLAENKRADATLAQEQNQFNQKLDLSKQKAQQDQLAQVQQRQDLIEQGTAELISKVKDKSAIQGKIEAMGEAYAANEKLKNRLNGVQMSDDDFAMTKQNFIETMNALPTQAEAYQQETGMMIGRDQAIRDATPKEDVFAPETDEGKRVKEIADAKRIFGEDSTEYKQLNEFFSQTGQEEQGAAETKILSLSDKIGNITSKIDEAISQTGYMTAGFASLSSAIPGTPAADLYNTLTTIQADAAFGALQEMRDNSKTGGALGQVSERELELLSAAQEAIKSSQSPEQLKKNLENYKSIRQQSFSRVKEAYRKDYGSLPQGLFGEQSSSDQTASKRRRYNPETGQLEDVQ